MTDYRRACRMVYASRDLSSVSRGAEQDQRKKTPGASRTGLQVVPCIPCIARDVFDAGQISARAIVSLCRVVDTPNERGANEHLLSYTTKHIVAYTLHFGRRCGEESNSDVRCCNKLRALDLVAPRPL
jgi:hypothetical protein